MLSVVHEKLTRNRLRTNAYAWSVMWRISVPRKPAFAENQRLWFAKIVNSREMKPMAGAPKGLEFVQDWHHDSPSSAFCLACLPKSCALAVIYKSKVEGETV